MTEKDAKVRQATTVQVGTCGSPHCGSMHVILRDENGETFASCSVQIELILDFLAYFVMNKSGGPTPSPEPPSGSKH